MDNKKYITCSLIESPEIFKGYVDNYYIQTEILNRLAKDLGFSFELYETLNNISESAASDIVVSMCKKSKHTTVNFLIDLESDEVLGYSLDDRLPLLNDEFMKRVTSLIETSKEIKIIESHYLKEDTKSSVLIKKLDPVTIDYHSSVASYYIGILIVNDEKETTYCRLVVFIEGNPIYLPASYYNTTINRYKRSTGNSAEALEVLILKVIDDLREDELKYKLSDFHLKYRVNKDILATYEEYNNVLRTMMKIPSIIEDRSFLESLSSKYEEFEKRYSNLDDQKSSYIWRCTAIGDLTIGALAHDIFCILEGLGAPISEYFSIRELLGTYLSTDRIVAEIAKESI